MIHLYKKGIKLTTTKGISECSDGWSKFEKHCYKLVSDPRDWDAARDFCLNEQVQSAKKNLSKNFNFQL